MRDRHPAQGAIARLPRPGLDAVATLRSRGDALGNELDRLAGTRPASAPILAVRQPRVGVRAQAVVDMERQYRDAERRRCGQGGVEQRARIAPAAVGDGNPRRRSSGVSAPSCR